MVTHSHGMFRATPGHLVFVVDQSGRQVDKAVASLKVGDLIMVASTDQAGEKMLRHSEVLAMHDDLGSDGLYAPLTPSGTLIVDDVVASNYATHSVEVSLPHGAAHALFFPLRLWHRFKFADLFSFFSTSLCSMGSPSDSRVCQLEREPEHDEDANDLHPFLELMYHRIRLDRLSRFLSSV